MYASNVRHAAMCLTRGVQSHIRGDRDVDRRRSRQADHYDEPIRGWFDGASHIPRGTTAFPAADYHYRHFRKSADFGSRPSAAGCDVYLEGDGQVRDRRLEL